MRATADVIYVNSTAIYPTVSGWQGVRGSPYDPNQVMISGTSKQDGLLYLGPFDGGGRTYCVDFPNASATSVYGPDAVGGDTIRLVGSYKMEGDSIYNHGFIWEGTLDELPSGGSFGTIDYPGAKYQYAHSTMGGLVVGNADGPMPIGGGATLPLGPGIAYLYDIASESFLPNIVFPGSISTTAYGIWYDGGTRYVICGGYVPATDKAPLGHGYLVDYDAATRQFSNWTSFNYPNGPESTDFVTHFEGISSVQRGVYTLAADSAQVGKTDTAQGSWVRVTRRTDGTFDAGLWVDLQYPGTTGLTSANSVFGTVVVGLVIGGQLSYQALVQGV